MANPQQNVDDELAPRLTEGYRLGQQKTVAELAALDQNDESLQRWKQSLGIGAGASSGGEKKVGGIEVAGLISCRIENEIVSGLQYIQVVKRAGITVDKTEVMLGSYGPQPEPYTKIFASEESPSGMLARSGSYIVRSRVVDDDNHVWLDFEWGMCHLQHDRSNICQDLRLVRSGREI
ncbi:uncharacterized protein L203_101500 [Cryptococcus depauperatus CBS 7841]|uniref:Rho GDP-dissociation inhibitor n=1 Tax=Cryptococcus depauperatus CBS 7841 TaxID=1295531 RepID=A0AAJ8JQ41_9TREE